jgi:hypothetical protein
MPIDFTQIDPEEFELLCEDLLQAMGFSIEAQVARGPDLGKDIIATQTVTDPTGGWAVKGCWLWPMPGQSDATLHGGLSLVECLVPLLRLQDRETKL